MFYEGNGLGGNHLIHYGRKGMKWGKNIFEGDSAVGNAAKYIDTRKREANSNLNNAAASAKYYMRTVSAAQRNERDMVRNIANSPTNIGGRYTKQGYASLERNGYHGDAYTNGFGLYNKPGGKVDRIFTAGWHASPNGGTQGYTHEYTRNTSGSEFIDSIVRGAAKLGLKALDTKLGQKIADKIYENSKSKKVSDLDKGSGVSLKSNKSTQTKSKGVVAARRKLTSLANYGNTWTRRKG